MDMEKIIAFFNGSQIETARQLDCSPAYISMCLKGTRKISPLKAIKIEKLTGISKTEIRPDIFDK